MTEFATHLLICLVTAHLLGDFVFQSDESTSRKRRLHVLVGHSLVVTLLSYVLCGLWSQWTIVLTIFLTHSLIDFIKVRVGDTGYRAFIADQLAHIAVIVGLVVVVSAEGSDPVTGYWVGLFGRVYHQGLILISGAIVAIVVGSIVTGFAVARFHDQLRVTRRDADTEPGKPLDGLARGFENGGRVIGMLERALIFTLVVVGQPAAIGFLIAAKSVFRFGEIRDKANRMETEYIIIGTLASFLFGFVTACVTVWVLRHVV